MEVRENNRIEHEEPTAVVAEVMSMSEIKCPLPLRRNRRSISDSSGDYIARGYYVSVSNDGVTYSEEDILIILDSTCVNCTVDGSTNCVVQVRII